MRIVLHVDLDAFFAAIEQKERPELRGKPVVVGADPKGGKGRGVVSTTSYEAREYGVHSGMPIAQAYRLCPHAAFVSVNFPVYRQYSDRIMAIIRPYAKRFQQMSIDEAFLELDCTFDEAREIAREIQNNVREKEGLSCSIGVGENKLVAKIASDFQKPNGITVVLPNSTRRFLQNLPVRKLYGVGKRTEEVLRGLTITTIGELAAYDKQRLMSYFGKWGIYLHLLANGIDASTVEEGDDMKSIGREITFDEDTDDYPTIEQTLVLLADDVCNEAVHQGYSFRTITIKVRFSSFETHTRQRTLKRLHSDRETINDVARELIQPFLETKQRMRLLGVRLSGLKIYGRQKQIGDYV